MKKLSSEVILSSHCLNVNIFNYFNEFIYKSVLVCRLYLQLVFLLLSILFNYTLIWEILIYFIGMER